MHGDLQLRNVTPCYRRIWTARSAVEGSLLLFRTEHGRNLLGRRCKTPRGLLGYRASHSPFLQEREDSRAQRPGGDLHPIGEYPRSQRLVSRGRMEARQKCHLAVDRVDERSI